jgi:hypothetical protein
VRATGGANSDIAATLWVLAAAVLLHLSLCDQKGPCERALPRAADAAAIKGPRQESESAARAHWPAAAAHRDVHPQSLDFRFKGRVLVLCPTCPSHGASGTATGSPALTESPRMLQGCQWAHAGMKGFLLFIAAHSQPTQPRIHHPTAGTIHRSGDAVIAAAYVEGVDTRFVIRPEPNPTGLPPVTLRSNVAQNLHLPVGCFVLSLEDARDGETPPHSAPPGLIDSVSFCVRALKARSSPYYMQSKDVMCANRRSCCEATAFVMDGFLRELLRHPDLSSNQTLLRVERLLSRLQCVVRSVVGTGGRSCTAADPRADTSFRLSFDPHLWNRITHHCTSEQLVPQSSSVFTEVGQAMYPVCMDSLLQARFGAACNAGLTIQLCRAAAREMPRLVVRFAVRGFLRRRSGAAPR